MRPNAPARELPDVPSFMVYLRTTRTFLPAFTPGSVFYY